MAQTTISIPVDSELTEFYNNGSSEDRRKIQLLLKMWLREIRDPNPVPLEEIESRGGYQTE